MTNTKNKVTFLVSSHANLSDLSVSNNIKFCQAQPSPNKSWAEVALVPIDPATHPPAGKVDTSLRYKSNYV